MVEEDWRERYADGEEEVERREGVAYHEGGKMKEGR